MTTLELSQPPPLFLHPTAISAQRYMYTTTYSQYQQRLYLLVVCGIFFTVKRERMPCGAAVSVLLFLLWSLAEVHSQTVPNLTFMGEIMSDHSYVDLSLVGDYFSDNVVICHTDLSTCCHGPDRGDWYFPNGDRLRFYANHPLAERRSLQRVELSRGYRSDSAPSGIYRCDIETRAVHSDDNTDTTTRETVYAGLYATGGKLTLLL